MARRLIAALLALGMSAQAAVPQAVQVPSLDTVGGTAVVLPGHWFPATGTGPTPALLLLHGCGGLYDGRNRLGERYVDMAQRLNGLGVHVLVTDALTPRGEKELCTQRTGSRRVTMAERRLDALGALQWLAAQPGVDAGRIGVLGWSNGGSAVLAATSLAHAAVRDAAVRPTLAAAFYPGCEAELRRGYRPVAPLLLLLGEADDWTPAAPCKALAAQAGAAGPAVQWEAYAGAYHGFDGRSAVRLRRDVPNGTHPGAGVHVGADPAARAAAAVRLEQFIRQTWNLPP